MKSKETLRKTIQSKRKFIDPADIEDKSRLIFHKLTQLPPIQHAETLITYLAKPDEVNTLDLIEWAHNKGKSVFTPLITGNGTMEWTRLDQPYTLKNGPLGIPIPETVDIATPPSDAPVIIPCVAFAENGHRIGHGAGYYDRFLATHTGLKIAIALEVQLVPDFPTDPHDIPMDAIITESTTYNITDAVND